MAVESLKTMCCLTSEGYAIHIIRMEDLATNVIKCFQYHSDELFYHVLIDNDNEIVLYIFIVSLLHS